LADMKKVPDPKEVNDFHEGSDVDRSTRAQHHTLGSLGSQASPGDHSHDGGSSKVLDVNDLPPPLSGTTISGAKTGNPAPALASVIAALVKLGAKDATTA
jgi:hypothetical protein